MKEKVKRGKDDEVNEQGGKEGAPAPHGGVLAKPNVDWLQWQRPTHYHSDDRCLLKTAFV